MSPTSPLLTPTEAWQPLPAADWNEAAARHLLQRIARQRQPGVLATIASASAMRATRKARFTSFIVRASPRSACNRSNRVWRLVQVILLYEVQVLFYVIKTG